MKKIMNASEMGRAGGAKRWLGKTREEISKAMSIISKKGWKTRKLLAYKNKKAKICR